MSEQTWLDVFNFQRHAQKRVLEKVYLANGEVVCRAPVCVHLAQFFRGQRVFGIRRKCLPCRSCESHFCILPLSDRAETLPQTPNTGHFSALASVSGGPTPDKPASWTRLACAFIRHRWYLARIFERKTYLASRNGCTIRISLTLLRT